MLVQSYFEGISTPPDDKYIKEEINAMVWKNRQEAREQYSQRQTEKYDRLAKYSLDKENQKRYTARREEWKHQAYRLVSRGKSSFVEIKQHQKISIKKVDSYSSGIYISDSANIKPRALHTINLNTQKALEQWGISFERKPQIVIVSSDEMPTAYGKYDAVTNTVYYIPQIANTNVAGALGDVEFHEMWHMKQAEDFRKKFGDITRKLWEIHRIFL